MPANARNMYVFRDGRQSVAGRDLVQALADEIRGLPLAAPFAAPDEKYRSATISALMRAGELECALVDAHSPEAPRLARVTDALASRLTGAPVDISSPESLLFLLPASAPACVHISPPEGFAYYALHPLSFADLAARVPVSGSSAAVVGVRSIGSTLSALVAAELRKRGLRVERITVRPAGHPYDRRTEFSPEQLRWIAEYRARLATFLVVDEGPGMSGSSFLSVGEALLGTGVPRDHVRLVCSRQPDVEALCARNARERWAGFRAYYAAPNSRLPAEAKVYIGAGGWRPVLLGDAAEWPASWVHMERLKFLSADGRELFKFEGFGRFGTDVHARAHWLAEAGYSPAPTGFIDGFSRYPVLAGRPLRHADVSRAVLDRMAQYCAFRAIAFPAAHRQQPEQIQTMLRFNVAEEFGVNLEAVGPFRTASPVIVDGRMLPHEWVQAGDGKLFKVDGVSHGDDHFFPGPTDIAWDLAGAVTEWNLTPDASDYFLKMYRHASGDDARPRLPAFLLAYTVFRMGYCAMAAEAVRGSGEESRLLRDYERYRDAAAAQLREEPMALQA